MHISGRGRVVTRGEHEAALLAWVRESKGLDKMCGSERSGEVGKVRGGGGSRGGNDAVADSS